jgi:osmotically-inducible protein OsmY
MKLLRHLFIVLTLTFNFVSLSHANELERLENEIHSAIQDLRLRRHSVESEYNDDGEVVLRGYVSSQEDKNLVVKRISSIPGVTKVEDSLTVKGSEGAIDSSSSKVNSENDLVRKEALLAVKKLSNLKSYEVDVSVGDKSIEVLGNATEPVDITKIGNAIREVAGKRVVENKMTLRTRPSDSELEELVRRALSEESNLDWQGIDISVHQGVAMFEGTKPSHRTIDRILSIANMVDGIARVDSKMTVSE